MTQHIVHLHCGLTFLPGRSGWAVLGCPISCSWHQAAGLGDRGWGEALAVGVLHCSSCTKSHVFLPYQLISWLRTPVDKKHGLHVLTFFALPFLSGAFLSVSHFRRKGVETTNNKNNPIISQKHLRILLQFL